MKRTKNINHSSFRKSWSARHLTPVALAVTAVFMLAGCEKSDETVSLYQNADDCSAANPGKAAECTTAYTNAVKEAERTAPKYATREDCVAEFGEGQCSKTMPPTSVIFRCAPAHSMSRSPGCCITATMRLAFRTFSMHIMA